MKISIFNGTAENQMKYVDQVVDVDIMTIQHWITTKAWAPSTFSETSINGKTVLHRKSVNLKYADVFGVDIDGGHTKEEAIQIITDNNLTAVVGTTRNHQKEKSTKNGFITPPCDRFRIVLPLEKPIFNDNQYKAVFKHIKSFFSHCDEACSDAARFYFPCKEIIFVNNGVSFPTTYADNIQPSLPLSFKIPNIGSQRGKLSTKTLDFIAHGAPDTLWHDRRTTALFDLKQQGYTIDEATVQIRKASQSAHGDLDKTDLYQIKDIYENREIKFPPRLPEEPQPLFRELPRAKDYPVKALGDILGPAVESLTNTSKAPLAMCAQSVLAAATLAVQPHRNVHIDNRVYPISQFFITIGESGERKSAVDSEALKSHREYERQQLVFFDQELLQYENEKEIYEFQKKKILGDKKVSKEDLRSKIQALGGPPTEPLSRILLIQEPTFEGLLKLLEKGQPTIGLFSDEGGRMIGGHGMNQDNQLKTMAGFCTLWDAKPISKVRSEAGSKNIYGKRFSLHLMLQPLVAQQLTGNSLATDQGLLSRCLFAYPESTVGSRMYVETNYNDLNLINYHQAMSNILNTKRPLAEGSKNELQPEKIELDFAAKKIWIEFHNYVEKNLSEQGEFFSIRSFGAKAAEHALRMAAVLTLIQNFKSQFIDRHNMQSAIELIHFYLTEALRLFSVSSINPDLLLADKLLRWCHNQKTEFVYIGLIYNKGPKSVRDKNTAEKVVKILLDHKHLVLVEGGMRLDGKHRTKVYQVIKQLFGELDPHAIFANAAISQVINSPESQKSHQHKGDD